MRRKIVNQADAARAKGVSRQRIFQLYSKGKFTIPVDENGNEVRGALYLDEVMAMEKGKHGRPRLDDDVPPKRGLCAFKIGDTIVWKHKPRDGYGFKIEIKSKVKKLAPSKLLITFKDGNRKIKSVWVRRSQCEPVK